MKSISVDITVLCKKAYLFSKLKVRVVDLMDCMVGRLAYS